MNIRQLSHDIVFEILKTENVIGAEDYKRHLSDYITDSDRSARKQDVNFC